MKAGRIKRGECVDDRKVLFSDSTRKPSSEGEKGGAILTRGDPRRKKCSA